jgi:hypothetical protein
MHNLFGKSVEGSWREGHKDGLRNVHYSYGKCLYGSKMLLPDEHNHITRDVWFKALLSESLPQC